MRGLTAKERELLEEWATLGPYPYPCGDGCSPPTGQPGITEATIAAAPTVSALIERGYLRKTSCSAAAEQRHVDLTELGLEALRVDREVRLLTG
jgi:hypothetical protein